MSTSPLHVTGATASKNRQDGLDRDSNAEVILLCARNSASCNARAMTMGRQSTKLGKCFESTRKVNVEKHAVPYHLQYPEDQDPTTQPR
jgi:hypothetical protein